MNEVWVLAVVEIGLVTYLTSLGLGMIVGQARGARYVNRLWLRVLTRTTALTLNIVSDLLRWVARSIRR